MKKPIFKINCFKENEGVYLIKSSREILPGIRTGKLSFEGKVESSGDYIDCGDPFDWKIYSGEILIASSIYSYDTERFIELIHVKEKEFFNHIMIFTYKKFESGLRFKEILNPSNLPERELTDGKNIKLGFRHDNPNISMAILIGKQFKDKKDNLYYGIGKLELGPVVSYEFSHNDGDKMFYDAWLKYSAVELVSFKKISSDEPDMDLEAQIEKLKIDLRATEKNLEFCGQNYLKLSNDYDSLQRQYDALKKENSKPSFWEWLFGKKK